MTVAEALRAASIDPRDARLLLAAATGLSEAGVVGFPERPVSADAESRFLEHCQRRRKGEPIAYIRGFKEWLSLRVMTDSRALIPRPETEQLVAYLVEEGTRDGVPSRIIDLGTGSGAIALAMARLQAAEVLLDQHGRHAPAWMALHSRNADLAGG